MSFSSEYDKLRRKRLEEEEKKKENSSKKAFAEELSSQREDNDIAPLGMMSGSDFRKSIIESPTRLELMRQNTARQNLLRNINASQSGSSSGSRGGGNFGETKERKWFESGLFEDGYQFGDVFKTLLSSGADLKSNLGGGLLEIGENVVDAGAYLVGGAAKLFGADEFAEDTKKFIADDLYDGEKVASYILSAPEQLILNTMGVEDYDDASIFGEKIDSLAQSGGQLAGTIALQSVGVPWYLTSGVTSFGSATESAFDEGASYGEAGAYGLISAGSEILTEKLFGGSGLGEKGLINLEPLTKGISNKLVKGLADWGIDMAAEGAEEVVSSVAGRLGSALYKEENLGTLLASEEAVDEYIESFIGGAVLSGVMNVSKANNARQSKGGRDYRTGLTSNEEKVFNKEYENRIAKEEQDGTKLSKKDKAKIYDEVLEDLKKGYISTDTIEEVLGGDTYKSYKDTIDSEDAILKEYEELGNKQNPTLAEQSRYAELTEKVKEIKNNSNRSNLKTQLGEEVFGIAKGDRLVESYNERARRSQAFEADLSKYDTKQQEVIKKAVDSGILNNTRRTHEFVDMVAKISADKGVLFDFTNNQKLKESGFAVGDGAVRNGYVTKDGITVNIDSSKSLNSVVGHEITHVLEGTELYTELQNAVEQYARSKGEYDSRLASVTELYKKYAPDSDPKAELTADLVGDYLFTDRDFINNLSVRHRNVFQKIYDEIKYLCKIATAGSKEARQLEKVKRAFDKAYNTNPTFDEDISSSLSDEETSLDKYSQKQYNDFGWARASDAISKNELDDMYSKIHEKGSLKKFPQTANGEAIIEVNNEPDTVLGVDNVFVFVTGTKNNPQINRVVRFQAETATEMEIIKGELYEGRTFSNPYYSFLKEYGFAREYSKKSSLDYLGYKETTRGRSGRAESNGTNGNGGFMQNGIRTLAETQSNEIAPIKQASSTDGVFFDAKNSDKNLSLSHEGYIPTKRGDFNFYGKDLMIAPTKETVSKTEMVDDIAPIMTEAESIAPIAEYEAIKPTVEKTKNTDKPIQTVKERKVAKLDAVQAELSNNRTLREESLSDYNQEIARLQADYDSKKNKNTKDANNLLRRIERTKRLRDSVDADYSKRISDLESKEKRVREGKPTTRQELHKNKVDGIKAKFAEKGKDFDDVLKKAKNLSTFSTVDNTPQRVMEKALGYEEGQILADETVNKVAQNETEGIKWLNSYTDRKKGLLASLSEQYNIKPGSKESAAAQMFAEGFYVNENEELVEYGLAELQSDFKDARVRNNIIKLASDPRIRQVYDETLAKINEARTRNAYPEIPRLDNYFLHFRAMEDTFSKLGLPFNPNDIRAKDIPANLNGVTADLKPGQPYFASAMHRKGKRTTYDLLGGLERYLSSAKNQIYHIDDIQTLRALRNYIADTYGQAEGLENLNLLSEEEAQERIKQVYGSHLSTFAKFLNEEANILAGKTALIDRGLEGIIGRRGITFLDTLNKQVGSNMVGLNVSSSLTNFLAGVQAIAKTNKFACIKSLAQTTSSKVGSIFGKTDSFVENNPTIIRRKGADRFYRTPFQKAGDVGYVLISAVDNVTTEFIVRAKYNEFIQKGMSEQQAVLEADKWTSRLMGDRSLGQMPQLYNSKMLGLITKFQLEVRNQLDSQFYDTIQEAKASNEDIKNGLKKNAKTAAKVTATFFQLAVLQHLFGKAFESVAGYNPAFDIIDVLIKTFGLDDEEDEDTALDNIEEGFLTLLEDLPYTSTFTGGRIPISSALPIEELIKGEDEYGNKKSRLETLRDIAPYYLLPGGYGQIKKTAQCWSMFDEDHPIAGSYTDSGNLRFPIDDTFANRVQAGLFGQWANENARDYFDNERNPLEEKQIQEFIDVGLPFQEYWEYREGLSGLNTLAEKADYINSLDLPVETKNILINNIADRKESIDMTDYGDYGSFEEFNYAQQNPEKYNFLKENNVSYEEFASMDEDAKNAYTWAFNNPEKFTLSKAIASDVVEYRKYTGELNDIKADKDENGKSISGSRKEKVYDYINNLDIDYGEKIILFKSEYNADDTYNYDIIEYLNSREDISYEEMETILKELGFTVLSDGTVQW